MDSIPYKDFLDMFDRMNMYIDVKGCRTSSDIARRMKRAINIMEKGVSRSKRVSTRKKWNRRIDLMWQALERGRLSEETIAKKRNLGLSPEKMSFPERVIYEATTRPHSIFNYALRYGYDRGKQKKMEDAKRRMGVLTVYKRGIHSRPKHR